MTLRESLDGYGKLNGRKKRKKMERHLTRWFTKVGVHIPFAYSTLRPGIFVMNIQGAFSKTSCGYKVLNQ